MSQNNLPPPPIRKQNNIGYNCSECSSLIEITSINEKENYLSFKCINSNNHNNEKIEINNYLEKMKNHIDNKNLLCKCEMHNYNEYISYCFDCKYHLCKECLKSKIHKEHNKIYLFELQPNDEELKIIKNKIENYFNKINNLKKEKEDKIKSIKKELNNHKNIKNKKFVKLLNEIDKKKDNEIELNKNKYIKDIEEIKRKYNEEIKLRKIKYEKENKLINKKYKMIKSKEILINDIKNKKFDEMCKNNNSLLLYEKKIDNLLEIIKINEIIYNTFKKCNNNYFYIINISNLINNCINNNTIIPNVNYKELCNDINLKNNNNNSFINNENIENNNNNIQFKNYIRAEIIIDEKNINKKVRILNSFEEFKKNYKTNINRKIYYKYENEKEIKDNCKIKINCNIIDFTNFYVFKEVGKYIIEYGFTNNMTKIDCLFAECNLFTKIDLSNFNTQEVTNMRNLFWKCENLLNINLSNIDSRNVINMAGLFFGCKSLKNVDLSNFNTQKVTDISSMFCECESLTNIDLTKFDTKSVTNMMSLFHRCISLTEINLSNFKTKGVVNMSCLFFECKSLKSVDISNFNIKNVTNNMLMFHGCESLTYVEIPKFKNIKDLFLRCPLLKKENIIIKK